MNSKLSKNSNYSSPVLFDSNSGTCFGIKKKQISQWKTNDIHQINSMEVIFKF